MRILINILIFVVSIFVAINLQANKLVKIEGVNLFNEDSSDSNFYKKNGYIYINPDFIHTMENTANGCVFSNWGNSDADNLDIAKMMDAIGNATMEAIDDIAQYKNSSMSPSPSWNLSYTKNKYPRFSFIKLDNANVGCDSVIKEIANPKKVVNLNNTFISLASVNKTTSNRYFNTSLIAAILPKYTCDDTGSCVSSSCLIYMLQSSVVFNVKEDCENIIKKTTANPKTKQK